MSKSNLGRLHRRMLMIAVLFLTLSPGIAVAAFDSSYYYPLDLNREAREVYGPSATAVALGPHLWDWRAYVNGQYYSLDLNHAVSAQYGSGWRLVSIGVGIYDWRAVNMNSLPNAVLPVMEIAYDRFFDVSAVSDGLSKFKSVLQMTQNWYAARAGRTVRMLLPIVIYTNRSSSSWNALSASTANSANRWDLLYELIAQYQNQLPTPASVKIAAAPYTGNSPDVYLGAASVDPFAIAAPRVTSVTCPATGTQDARCADAGYAFGHELGHLWGLGHSCDVYPLVRNCGNSIMQTAKPWNAIFLTGEISTLSASPFLQ
ncbi:MAG TPA: hypothetical protein VG477_11545 [Thermoanaerobaculia bacterium]|nr:hypothetical protein [Thermoanaerobaculia bacterium]